MQFETTEARFHFRRFDKETDFTGLIPLLTEIERVDQAGEDISEETLTALLTLPGHHPAQDRHVALSLDNGENLFGFSSVWKVPQNKHADIYVGVHPAYRRHGIGTVLLQHTLARAHELDARDILASVDARNQEALDFLRKRAFAPISAYTRMQLAASTPLPQPTWPTGYTIRVYNPTKDFPLLLAMYNQAFQGLWGHWEHVPEEDLRDILKNQDPADIFLLFTPDGEVIGTCRGERSEQLSARRGRPTGYLDCPGIVPEYRDKDLYLPLLLHVALWVRSQGDIDIELESWGDDPRVLAQFQATGFTIFQKQDIYRWQGQ